MADNSKKKPDLRDSVGRGTIKTDTEAHVVGADEAKVPDDPFHLVRPEPGNLPAGQATKG